MDFMVTISPAVGFLQMKCACHLQHNYSQVYHHEDVSLKKKYLNNLI